MYELVYSVPYLLLLIILLLIFIMLLLFTSIIMFYLPINSGCVPMICHLLSVGLYTLPVIRLFMAGSYFYSLCLAYASIISTYVLIFVYIYMIEIFTLMKRYVISVINNTPSMSDFIDYVWKLGD